MKTMPTCSKCGKEKDVNLFIKRYSKGRRGKPSSWCKSCFSINQMVQWNATKVEVVRKLGNRCSDCGHSFHPATYDFHHIDPTMKSFGWSELRKRSKADVWKEIKKCILLCGNCHRLRHINPETWKLAIIEADQRKEGESNP